MKSLICEFYSLGVDLKFAVCSACGQRFHEMRELTILDRLSVSAVGLSEYW